MLSPRPRAPLVPPGFGSRQAAIAYGQAMADLMRRWGEQRLKADGPLADYKPRSLEAYLVIEVCLRQEFGKSAMGRPAADLLVADILASGLPSTVEITGPGIDGTRLDTDSVHGRIVRNIAYALTLSDASFLAD